MVMLRHDNEYRSVRRVVIGNDLPTAFQWAIRGLAERLRLEVSPPETSPEPGDYRFGSQNIEAGLAALRSELKITGV